MVKETVVWKFHLPIYSEPTELGTITTKIREYVYWESSKLFHYYIYKFNANAIL